MRTAFWEQVAAHGFAVPAGEPLADLTAELTVMLGDPDPHVRQDLAAGTVAAWVGEGVYDELLSGLGDGLAAGLRTGLGEQGTDTVFRRCLSAALLGECLERDSRMHLAGPDAVLRWGDALLSWYVREKDLRGHVPGRGGAHALRHGAAALAALADSPSLGEPELAAVLDVLADRLTIAPVQPPDQGDVDRMAGCALAVARRGAVTDEVVGAWLARLVDLSRSRDDTGQPTVPASTAESFLRSLHLQVALGARPPANRSDLLLEVIAALRRSDAELLR